MCVCVHVQRCNITSRVDFWRILEPFARVHCLERSIRQSAYSFALPIASQQVLRPITARTRRNQGRLARGFLHFARICVRLYLQLRPEIASLKGRKCAAVCAYNCLPADYRRDISRFSPFRPLASPHRIHAALSLAYRASNRDKSGQSVREHTSISHWIFIGGYVWRNVLVMGASTCFRTRRFVLLPPSRRPATVAVASCDGPTPTNSSYLCTAASSTMMREISRSRVPIMLSRR